MGPYVRRYLGAGLVLGVAILMAATGPLQAAPAHGQDPGPPQIPQPFPGTSDAEKIRRLAAENGQLRQQNSDLRQQADSLRGENLALQEEISGLNETIQGLREITLEQIRIIVELSDRLRGIAYGGILAPLIDL